MMHVACTADEGYAPHCATMLVSLLAHNDPAGICIHYLHPQDLDAGVRAAIEQLVRARGATIRCHAFADAEIAGLPSWPGLRPVMWYRVLLPERLPELDRILYIDADAVVLDSLAGLWSTDLRGNYLAAVTNVAPPLFADHPLEIGLPDRASYFNSGVMLLNLARMRAEGSSARMIAHARAHPLKWWDQDGLNLLFHRERIALHPRWNCMNSLFLFAEARRAFGGAIVDEARTHPAVVHFEGPGLLKPWHFLSKHPYQEHYLRYRAQTPWPLRELEGRTLRNHVLRLLPWAGILGVVGLDFRARAWLRALNQRVVRRLRGLATTP